MFFDLAEAFQHALVVTREDLEELRQLGIPVGEQVLATRRAGELDMLFDFRLHIGDVRITALDEAVEVDHVLVEAFFEKSVEVVDIGHAARHACSEVASGRAENDHLSARHVFAAVVAHAFDDGFDARVADAEAFACDAVDVGFAGSRAVEGDIADEDVVFGGKERSAGRVDRDLGAGEAFADIVVGVALEGEGHAWWAERGERLTGAAVEL